jgi:BirA family biotin operon repressor/biotin-[acetyl-CoA-carboxylase] ligase
LSDDLPRPTAPPPDVAGALARLRPRVSPQVSWFASVASTNDVAARLAEGGAPHLTAVIAEQQTAGRGRLGRTWYSPPGAGLYVSFVLRPRIGPGPISGRVPLVSLTAGVAFAEAVRLCTRLPVTVKWPNDLVVERRKLAGILTEASGNGDFEYVIVGFGLNLRPAAYPPEIADRATSVEAELGRPLDRGMVLAQCFESMALWTDALLAGKADAILERWRSLAPSARGSRVAWASTAGLQEGVTDGIDDDGALLVRTGSGTERIIAGEVKWL